MLRNQALYPTATLEFLRESQATIRTVESKRSYEKCLRLLQSRHPGKRVSEFSEADVVAFVSEGGKAPATLAQRRTVLIAFFEWAAWRKLASLDPLVAVRRIKIRFKGVKRHNWLTPVQLKALRVACEDGSLTGARDLVLIVTGVMTGLRCAELAGLRWGSVALASGTLSVVGKGEKPAVLGIPARLVEVLSGWRGQCATGLGRPPAGQDPVFPRCRVGTHWGTGERMFWVDWTRPIGKEAIRFQVQRRGEKAGIRGLAPHDLRRTFAGLAEEQFDLLTVSHLLRHTSVGTTQRYLERNPKRAIEAGRGFDVAL